MSEALLPQESFAALFGHKQFLNVYNVYECEVFQGIHCFIAFNFNGKDSQVKEKVAWPTSYAVWSVG